MTLESVIRNTNAIAHCFSAGYWSRKAKAMWQRPVQVSPGTPTRCREIVATDLDRVIDLLTTGFTERRRDYWEKAIRRLSVHPTPDGFPRYGYVLECNDNLVGVLLVLCTAGTSNVRCNESSFYIAPDYRCYAPIMLRRVLRRRDATYTNITPARHTFAALDANRYHRFADGMFIAVPSLSKPVPAATVKPVGDWFHDNRLSDYENNLLVDHAGYGCISLVCEYGGKIYPFVFARRIVYRLPFGHLIYCREHSDLILLAGSLGRFLLRHGILAMILDTNGPIEGLAGKYLMMQPKYWRGDGEPPRLGDLAYTEVVMFGF